MSREVSVQGRFSVKGGLCLGVSVQGVSGVSVKGVSVQGRSLSKGVSVHGVSVQEGLCQGDPRTVTCGQNTSYWNAFLFTIKTIKVILKRRNVQIEGKINSIKNYKHRHESNYLNALVK